MREWCSHTGASADQALLHLIERGGFPEPCLAERPEVAQRWRRYLDILAALYVVIEVQPWHRNIARALLQALKVYFTDTGLVKGDAGVRFENAVAVMLCKQVHHLVDTRGCEAGLYYIRTKDGAEVDFSLSVEGSLTHVVACKLADSSPHRALSRFALQFPEAEAVQLVRDARQQEQRGAVAVVPAGEWLARLAV